MLLIAAAPSFPAELVGRALSDEAREVLAAAGVDVAAVAATTLVKCRPPAGRTPTADEIAACRPLLEEQVAEQLPETVIALGATVLRSLAPGAPPLSDLHGHSRPGTIGEHEVRAAARARPVRRRRGAVAGAAALRPTSAARLPWRARRRQPRRTAAPAEEPEPDEAPPQLGLF